MPGDSQCFCELQVYVTGVRKATPEPQPNEESGVLAGLWVPENIPVAGSAAGSHPQPCPAVAGTGFIGFQCCWLCTARVDSLLPRRAPLLPRHGGTWCSGPANLSPQG